MADKSRYNIHENGLKRKLHLQNQNLFNPWCQPHYEMHETSSSHSYRTTAAFVGSFRKLCKIATVSHYDVNILYTSVEILKLKYGLFMNKTN